MTPRSSSNPKLPGALYGRGVAKARKGDKAGGSADITAAKSDEVGHRVRVLALRHPPVRTRAWRAATPRQLATANLIANSTARTSTAGDASPTLPATSLITA